MADKEAPSLDLTLDVLRAAAEETRLRILSLLAEGELSVSDLTDILGQSQPRISRHLKLLVEAGGSPALGGSMPSMVRCAGSEPNGRFEVKIWE